MVLRRFTALVFVSFFWIACTSSDSKFNSQNAGVQKVSPTPNSGFSPTPTATGTATATPTATITPTPVPD
jgi:hypothetical protein